MANQYSVDPRQALFLTYYLDFKSETFSNALQSALKAGYAQEYAENITSQMPDWLSEKLGNNKRLDKAEKVLDEMLELKSDDNPAMIKIKQDTAKFIAERLGKEKYSTRSELTGKNGESVIVGINYVQPNNDNPGAQPEATPGILSIEE